MLLPPNIEVLKITPFAWEMPVLWKLVERKAEDPSFLTNLRKVILVRHFRDQSMVRIPQSVKLTSKFSPKTKVLTLV
jgi:hypothetical protein